MTRLQMGRKFGMYSYTCTVVQYCTGTPIEYTSAVHVYKGDPDHLQMGRKSGAPSCEVDLRRRGSYPEIHGTQYTILCVKYFARGEWTLCDTL